ncbi:MAG: type II secretion system protein GspM [Neomegalonema sp.]|nr:type II secretion system protein GspM [Neomegalonema sp.]
MSDPSRSSAVSAHPVRARSLTVGSAPRDWLSLVWVRILLVAALLLAWGALMLWNQAIRDEQAQLAARLASLRALEARGPQVQARLETLQRSDSAGRSALLAPSEAIAAATAQRHMLALLTSAGNRIDTVQITEDQEGSDDRGSSVIALDITLSGSLETLALGLIDLETQEPPVWIRTLELAHNGQQARSGDAPILRARIEARMRWQQARGQ